MEELNIRVNTLSEKIALKQLVKGLRVIGITLDDLKEYKVILTENVMLRAENKRLNNELIKANEDKNKKVDYISFLTKKEELK